VVGRGSSAPIGASTKPFVKQVFFILRRVDGGFHDESRLASGSTEDRCHSTIVGSYKSTGAAEFRYWILLRMKMLLRPVSFAALICGFWWMAGTIRAGTIITDAEAVNHVGQDVTVEGTITKVFKSKNGNTFLNFGGDYPDVTFVVWIPQDAPESADPSLANLQGKKVKIIGRIQIYRGKPEIKVSTKEQIVME
jgi:hypothetical protein